MHIGVMPQPDEDTGILTSNQISRYANNPNKLSQMDKWLFRTLPILFFLMLSGFFIYAAFVQGTKQQLLDIDSVEAMITSKKKLPDYVPKDFYWFSVSIRDLILDSDLDSLYKQDRTVYSLKKEKHLRAILLTQLVHNVNFKGEIDIELSPFDTGLWQKTKAIQKIMAMQRQYYESQYQISQFQQFQLPFCIVIPSYNNVKSRLYLRNLDSIFMQQYKNYHVVYIDDKSPQKTGQHVTEYLKKKQIPEQKIKVIINDQNKKALMNIYEGVHQHCNDGEIVGLIDGDDSLNGRLVLKLYNTLYHRKRLGVMYSNFLKITENSRTEFGFGSQVSDQYYREGKLRNYWPIVGTHFMTFYKDVFKHINKSSLCYENGTFFDYAYDRAILTPILQLSYPRFYYLPQMTYEYRNDTGNNDGAGDWIRVSNMIRALPPYEALRTFEFIDQHEVIKKGEEFYKREKQ